MKKYLALLPLLLLPSCGMEITYENEKTGIRVTEVIDGKLKPVVDFSNFKWGSKRGPFEINPIK